GDRRSGKEHRFEHGEGRHRAGASDVDVDPLQQGGLLLSGELERHGPSRELAREPERTALVVVIDLDHYAVGIELELTTAIGPVATEGDERLDAGAALPVRLHRQPPTPQ